MAQQTIGLGTAANDGTGDPLRTAFTKANQNFTDLYESTYTRVFDVTQYGAVFDGSSQIYSGVQAAIDAARNYLASGSYRSAEIVFPPGKPFGRLGQTLDFTGITDLSDTLTVRWNRIGVLAATNGKPAIDAMGSRNIIWDGVHISGAAGAAAPSTGIQFGRTNTTALNNGGNSMKMLNCRLVDNYQLSSLYNFSGESCYYVGCDIVNALGYAAIFDGINHFGVTSDFVAQSAPANTPQSFNQNLAVRCNFGAPGQTAAIWRSGCRQHEFQSCYAYVPGGYGIHEYCMAGGVSTASKLDLHVEGIGGGTAALGYILIDGPLANPVFGGLDIRVAFIYANRLFKTQGSVTSVGVRSLKLDLASEVFSGISSTFRVFDDPNIWTVDGGTVNVLSRAHWNLPDSQKVILNGVPYITCDMA